MIDRHKEAAETMTVAAGAAMRALQSVIRFYQERPHQAEAFGVGRLHACHEAERELRRAFANVISSEIGRLDA